MVHNTLANTRASAPHGTQPQPLSEVPLRRWFTNKKEWQSLKNLYSHKSSTEFHGLLYTSVQSLCSMWGEGVSSMRGWLIDFKAQLTSQVMSFVVYGMTFEVVP
ncbi:hypothetical protein PIB30_043981 [Stylosanthes scabra]|uniref:Uncharacterized protein n=1 Tax=Stylosanthes scabra TaxID=79078 RepID=A0ABU6SGY8_9FABA|nr:hypothetical protein [Stylosanthes scabra]